MSNYEENDKINVDDAIDDRIVWGECDDGVLFHQGLRDELCPKQKSRGLCGKRTRPTGCPKRKRHERTSPQSPGSGGTVHSCHSTEPSIKNRANPQRKRIIAEMKGVSVRSSATYSSEQSTSVDVQMEWHNMALKLRTCPDDLLRDRWRFLIFQHCRSWMDKSLSSPRNTQVNFQLFTSACFSTHLSALKDWG